MKAFLISIFFLGVVALEYSFAQVASPSPTPTVAASPAVTPSASDPVPPAGAPTIPVAEPAAPPQWAQQILVSAQKLPVVGPIVSKAILYVGVVVPVLTGVIAILLTILNALSGIASLSGLVAFSQKLKAFQSGKIMYYLMYLSMFNAKKPESPDVLQPLAKA